MNRYKLPAAMLLALSVDQTSGWVSVGLGAVCVGWCLWELLKPEPTPVPDRWYTEGPVTRTVRECLEDNARRERMRQKEQGNWTYIS